MRHVAEALSSDGTQRYWFDGLPFDELAGAAGMYSMTTVEKRSITLNPDGPLDGDPVWEETNPAVANLDVATGGMSAYVEGAAPGTTTVTVRATSLGNPLSASFDFTVTAPPATTLGAVVGPAEAK